jgi:hypothetical protein
MTANEPDLYLFNQLFGDRPSDQIGAPTIQPGSKEEAAYKQQEQYWQEQREAAANVPEADISQTTFEKEIALLRAERANTLHPEITHGDISRLIEMYLFRTTCKYWTPFSTFVEEVHTREHMRLPLWLQQMLEVTPHFRQATSDELYPETGE